MDEGRSSDGNVGTPAKKKTVKEQRQVIVAQRGTVSSRARYGLKRYYTSRAQNKQSTAASQHRAYCTEHTVPSLRWIFGFPRQQPTEAPPINCIKTVLRNHEARFPVGAFHGEVMIQMQRWASMLSDERSPSAKPLVALRARLWDRVVYR